MRQQGHTTLTGAERRAVLRSRIRKGELVVAPGVFEMISANWLETDSISASRRPASSAAREPPTTSCVVSSMAEMASFVSV